MLSTRGAKFSALLALLSVLDTASAQHYRRLGACPKLGCVFPPDQTDFIPGQLFDIRLEVHAPESGREASNNGAPDEKFSFCIQRGTGTCEDVSKFFSVKEPALEKWSFSYFEDLFAQDAKQSTNVNVASKIYRAVSLPSPGKYTAVLTYNGKSQTVANWVVRDTSKQRKAKNVLFFIGDGMTQAMITAARLIGHKSINGRYQSLMQLDQMENLGLQMTHSIDSFITDSANSASALYTGKKTAVSALNVWADSSANSFDDPKFETIAELFRRHRQGGALGIVSTAVIADATPAALCAHTRNRDELATVIYEFLNGAEGLNSTFAWPTSCEQPDVIFGGGAELFYPNSKSYGGVDMYKAFKDKGYNLVQSKTQLASAPNDKKTLGIFSTSNLAKWVDRNIFPNNLKNQKSSPTGDGTDAVDQPGLKDMTLKAIDILQARADKNAGWFMMSEAASIDKMMHVLDYDRALGELLELDDTVRASIEHLEKIGELENTLIVVTADHGHGFDVFGGADTKYLSAATGDRAKRRAVGTYAASGLSEYQVAPGSSPDNTTIVVGPFGPNFPVQWTPRYTFAGGVGGNPDRVENYKIHTNGPRLPAVSSSDGYIVNPADNTDGFHVSGTLGPDEAQGVHSLTDVSVFSKGPGSDAFRGVFNSIDIFYKIADALGLGDTGKGQEHGNGNNGH
ncbi:alkaline phosphatase-like protein [Macrolepiota fuliginosa MF-IS2]|uniref:alkaline phosphatase n=1 Tax=Macrolepiota fuliginosa MF-IS2 TaxID=1400762 RepID=A0A9P5XFY7_9AGAR|nr:alkaline phosphatase-like protein [Macrolepiota fuliginosa MF-IS2]